MTDTHVRPDPSAEELAEIAALSAKHVERFGLKPKIAFLSHSNFGSYDSASARKMRRATELLHAAHPELEADGEMHADMALSQISRARVLPHTCLEGNANILVMPNLDAANIAYQMTKGLTDALPVGPDPHRSRRGRRTSSRRR